jgi:hypothetical protein
MRERKPTSLIWGAIELATDQAPAILVQYRAATLHDARLSAKYAEIGHGSSVTHDVWLRRCSYHRPYDLDLGLTKWKAEPNESSPRLG